MVDLPTVSSKDLQLTEFCKCTSHIKNSTQIVDCPICFFTGLDACVCSNFLEQILICVHLIKVVMRPSLSQISTLVVNLLASQERVLGLNSPFGYKVGHSRHVGGWTIWAQLRAVCFLGPQG